MWSTPQQPKPKPNPLGYHGDPIKGYGWGTWAPIGSGMNYGRFFSWGDDDTAARTMYDGNPQFAFNTAVDLMNPQRDTFRANWMRNQFDNAHDDWARTTAQPSNQNLSLTDFLNGYGIKLENRWDMLASSKKGLDTQWQPQGRFL
jgi:hypothetical protein